jgi:CheY-like chemotaxis protein
VSSGEALMTVLNDILDFSKLEAGSLEFVEETFSVASTVESVASLMRPRAGEKGVGLQATVSPLVPPYLIGDPIRLRQVLLNLVGNAIKFTAQGSVNIRVEPQKGDASATPGVSLRFTVTDTGIGIAEDAKKNLFRSFSQADSSISRRFGGTGLGLAICKKIIGLQGGQIGFESRPDRGSRFWFILSFAVGQAPQLVEPTQKKPLGVHPMNILLAEDSTVNQRVVVGILGRRGHKVTVAKDGKVALDAASRQRFDLILMDMHMPEMDGLEATRLIRELGSPLGKVPIIALTAAAFREHSQACLDAGMDEVVHKPFQPDHLTAVVERYGVPKDAVAFMSGPSELPLQPRVRGATLTASRLDLPLLATLREQLGDDTVRAIVTEYVSNSASLMAVIDDDGQDIKARYEAAHSLKGASGVLGLAEMRDICERIELGCREGRPESVAAQIAVLSTKLSEGVALLRQELETV